MKNKQIILKLIEESKEGLSIQELSKLTNLSRTTVKIALAELEGSGKIKSKKRGNLRIHYV